MNRKEVLQRYRSILNSYKNSNYNNYFKSDKETIANDFKMVGYDIKEAIKKIEKELKLNKDNNN